MADNFWLARRNELDLSQYDIAVASGYTPAAVGAWETDKSAPRLTSAPKLAPVYKLSVERIEREIVAASRRVAAKREAAGASK